MFLTHLIIASIGVFVSLRYQGKFHKMIAFGISICVTLPFLVNRIITTCTFIILGLMALLTSLYGLRELFITKTERVAIILTGIVMAASIFMKVQHQPSGGVLRILMIIPIASLLFILIKKKRVTKEVSFMLYWAFYAVTQLAQLGYK